MKVVILSQCVLVHYTDDEIGWLVSHRHMESFSLSLRDDNKELHYSKYAASLYYKSLIEKLVSLHRNATNF